MDFGPLLYIAPVLFLAWVLWRATRGVRLDREQRQGALAADAAVRGWTFEQGSDGLFDLTRWSGQTDGVRWTAEYRRSRHRKSSGPSRTHRLRWWTEGRVTHAAPPLLFMGVPRGQETPAVRLAQGDGLLASMAQKAAGFVLDQSLDLYFGQAQGRQVDAHQLRMVEGVSLPGFIVMTADVDQGRAWLAGFGHRAALDAQLSDPASAFSDEQDRPWVLLQGSYLGLSQSVEVLSTHDLERLLRAGVALAQALR
jgi:hypothetical protein